MLVRVALCLAMLLAAVPVQAASFDCSKAETAMEQAICADPALSKADETLAKAYATALGGLSEAASAAVRQGQKAWLDYAERACTDDAMPLSGSYDEDGVACLLQTFTNRIGRLEASRMQSGRRFYPLDRYAVSVDPQAEADAWNKVTTKQFSSLRIDGEDEEAEAFNALMERYDATLQQGAGSGEEGDINPATDSSTDTDTTIAVDAVSSRRISLSINEWWYGHGAAHGNYTVSHLHFLLDEKRELSADDIFEAAGWQAALAELVLSELDRMLDGGVWPDSEDVVAEAVSQPERWSFSESGLGVQFQPYEVAAYAVGAPTAIIPWATLGEYMAEGGMEIATY